MKLDFSKILAYIPKYVDGLELTLQITVISLAGAFVLACLLVMLGMSGHRILRGLAAFYVSFFRGVPIIVQFFLIHFLIPGLTNNAVVLPTAVDGMITFALNSAAYLAESIRGGINGVDKGQHEAAKALGISGFQMMVFVVVPQALKVVFPSVINTSIKLVKDSAIVSQLGAFDLMRSAYFTMSNTYRAFESLIMCAVFYLIIVITLTLISKLAEKRLNRSEMA